jgi:hypothetical protein
VCVRPPGTRMSAVALGCNAAAMRPNHVRHVDSTASDGRPKWPRSATAPKLHIASDGMLAYLPARVGMRQQGAYGQDSEVRLEL